MFLCFGNMLTLHPSQKLVKNTWINGKWPSLHFVEDRLQQITWSSHIHSSIPHPKDIFIRYCLVGVSKAFNRFDHIEALKSAFGVHKVWESLYAGVLQGTRLGPPIFLATVNDLSLVLLDYISEWTASNNMRSNVKKSKSFFLEPKTVDNHWPIHWSR